MTKRYHTGHSHVTNNQELHKSHDRFFRQSLADLQIARDFLQAHLPVDLLNRVDLNTLEICKESYIEEQLNESISDIVYRVIVDEEYQGYFYLAIEHQSTAKEQNFMAFRFMKYQLAIVDNHLKQHKKNKYLPIVFPILFYHGKKIPYVETTDFFKLFFNVDLAKRCFLQPFHLIDIGKISDDEIKKHKLASLLEIVQKHIYDRDCLLLIDQLSDVILNVLSISDASHALIYIKNTLYYLMNKANISDKIQFKNALEAIPEIKEQGLMSTMAEDYINEGIKKGIQQGIQQGVQQGMQQGKKEGEQETFKVVAFKLLQSGMCCSEISKITGMSKEEIKELDNSHECNH
jgi:predicted transposase/invertase (TIGR01784 family)